MQIIISNIGDQRLVASAKTHHALMRHNDQKVTATVILSAIAVNVCREGSWSELDDRIS